jgi:hypothetical protein
MKRKFRLFIEEVGNDGSEFRLVFSRDGVWVDFKIEYSIDDCLIDCSEFWKENCEKYEFDSRFDSMEIDLRYMMGM